MSSKRRPKSILKESIDSFEEVLRSRPPPQPSSSGAVGRAEQLFDNFIASNAGPKRVVDTYSNRNRKPFTTICANLGPKQTPLDSSVDEECGDGDGDNDFEPKTKASRIRPKKRPPKANQNRVKFMDISEQKVTKKCQNKKTVSKKSADYPDCTKEALLKAFESAGLPDYEEIARHELHTTNVKDVVKAYPPTPSMNDIMKPFADLVDWSKADITQDVTLDVEDNDNNDVSAQPMEKTTTDWETEPNDSNDNEVFVDSDVESSSKSLSNRTVLKVSTKSMANTTRSRSKLKLRTSRESIATAGLGAARIASTPVTRRHNVTLKNVSPIESTESPVDCDTKKAKVTQMEDTFVAPLPVVQRPQRSTRVSHRVHKVSTIPLVNNRLEIVEPMLSDLEKVTQHSRSDRISRTLIDIENSCSGCETNSNESQTLVEKTALEVASNSDENTLISNKRSILRSRNTSNELSSIFAPKIRSTPLVSSKQKQTNSRNELIVDRSHFDVSMFKMCRSLSVSHIESTAKKTTTIVPVINTDFFTSSRKSTIKSKPYHTYRQSIASVHSQYNQSSQPFRTVVRTATPVGAHSFAEFGDNRTIRTQFASKEHLKQCIDSSLSQTLFSASKVVVDGRQTLLSAKHKVLLLCDPNEVIHFEDVFEPKVLKTCRKIGEGSYGEVFMAKDGTDRDIVIKVIALINSGHQEEEELFSQILPELVISKEFNKLKTGLTSNRAPNYIDMLRVTTTRGLFPQKLMDEWNAFDDEKTSENEDPKNYTEDQLYVVLQLANGGTDLEARQFKSAVETLSIFGQLALSLAAAEMAYEFEHRDMHWGNVLVSMADVSHLQYCVNGQNYSLRANGVFASLIDFSLSRMSSDGFIIYDDLEKYSDLFEGRGDYQFDVYRKMRVNNQKDWQKFSPKTNIFWLHYMLDKVIKEKKYSANRTKSHRNSMQVLKSMFNDINDYHSATHLVGSEQFEGILTHLESN